MDFAAALPFAAAGDTAAVLTDLFLVLVAAKLGDEVFKRSGSRRSSASTETSVFLGAALAATSAGITPATFLDLGIARSRAARTVLGVALGARGGRRLRRLRRAGRYAAPAEPPRSSWRPRASPTRRCCRR